MTWLIYLAWVIAAFVAMEFIAWFTHKYLMHGLLWNWHEDHHKPNENDGFFEKNDRFFLVFAIPSALCYMLGSYSADLRFLLFIGIGISLYGLTYFLIHDVYIHQRFNWFRQLESKYSKAILRAHGAHHSVQTKEECESFGLLFVSQRFFKKRSKLHKKANSSS